MDIRPIAVRRMLNLMKGSETEQSYTERLLTKTSLPKVKRLRPHQTASEGSVEKIWNQLIAESSANIDDKTELADPLSLMRAKTYTANIENYIGTVKIPLGVVGPIRIHGTHAH